MKKKLLILIACIITIVAIATTTYAYNSTISDTEYISIMNENIDIISSKIKHKGGSQWKALFGNVDNDYLKPELDRLNILKSGCESIRDKAAALNIRNKDTKEINDTIIDKYSQVIELIDSDIATKENILNLNIDQSEKFNMLKDLSYTIKDDIDNKLYDINTILQKLEIETLK